MHAIALSVFLSVLGSVSFAHASERMPEPAQQRETAANPGYAQEIPVGSVFEQVSSGILIPPQADSLKFTHTIPGTDHSLIANLYLKTASDQARFYTYPTLVVKSVVSRELGVGYGWYGESFGFVTEIALESEVFSGMTVFRNIPTRSPNVPLHYENDVTVDQLQDLLRSVLRLRLAPPVIIDRP